MSRGCRIKFRVSGKAFATIERRKRLGGGRTARLAAAAEIPKGASKLAPFKARVFALPVLITLPRTGASLALLQPAKSNTITGNSEKQAVSKYSCS